MSTFNLRERAEELFGEDGSTFSREGAASYAIQLATEALEAAAQTIETKKCWDTSVGGFRGAAAAVVRSFIAKPGAQEERAPRVQSSPDASHGERVSADAPPAPPYEQRRSHDTGGPGGSLPSSGAAASAPSRPGDPLRQSHGKIRDNPRAGDLSDADALVRAAEIMESISGTGFLVGTHTMRDQAARLRAAEEVDVFEAFRLSYANDYTKWPDVLARSWFGPLVTALASIRDGTHEGSVEREASEALSALRERARAAGGGR